mmetsp:Transcript_67679/g.120515  ORF Transcript_67679/g.120515 Transcript_67679/m.120515 type:complete len:209 (-) Transcript_67679:717-1343(-)
MSDARALLRLRWLLMLLVIWLETISRGGKDWLTVATFKLRLFSLSKKRMRSSACLSLSCHCPSLVAEAMSFISMAFCASRSISCAARCRPATSSRSKTPLWRSSFNSLVSSWTRCSKSCMEVSVWCLRRSWFCTLDSSSMMMLRLEWISRCSVLSEVFKFSICFSTSSARSRNCLACCCSDSSCTSRLPIVRLSLFCTSSSWVSSSSI